MGLLTTIICIGCAVFALIAYKNIMNPQVLFCGFIGIISFLSCLRLFGLSQTSDFTYILVILGVVFYSIGVSISHKYTFKINNKKLDLLGTKRNIVNDKFIFALVTVLLIWTLYRFVTMVLPMLRGGYSLDMIRMVYFGNDVAGYSYNRIDTIVEMFVNLPFLYALIPIVSIELTHGKKEKELRTRTIVIALVWIVLSCIVSGGRVLIYNLSVVLVMAFLSHRFIKNSNRVKLRNNKRNIVILIVLAFLVYVMYQLSINRTGSGTYEFFYQIYVYFCGCMPHTSLRLETVNFDYTYGMTFISGLLRPIMLVLKYLGSGQFPAIYQRTIDIGVTLQTAVKISEGHTFNAFVLPFYYFYFDGGVIAVVIESFLYGLFCGTVFFKSVREYNKKRLAKYLLIIIYIATSMIRFSPSLVYFAFAYFYMNFCYKRGK
ncbi:O-antigen polymerase [Anaerorhabdus furcosa]|uniref:Oligosaccharide repeat unit polymerase n=1 Tax=Anaerorhabdus furcosa TaxID=118967 RepID=A0A1T4NDE8_9FIRM|nr:O-antigen polymerase [Anaerorhabdus furcosa]SJZ77153.1 oligosaccharide repeat unit polymerase [Anaerorhabdus furcosa]